MPRSSACSDATDDDGPAGRRRACGRVRRGAPMSSRKGRAARHRCAFRVARSGAPSRRRTGNWNDGGITPRIVTERPFKVTTRPATVGSAPNWRAHHPALITATSGPSAGVNTRPTSSRHTEHVEERQVGLHRSETLDAPGAGQMCGRESVAGHGGDLGAAAVRVELLRANRRAHVVGCHAAVLTPLAAEDLDQPVGLVERQGPQQHAVDDAEDRGGRAGRQRERQRSPWPRTPASAPASARRSACPAPDRSSHCQPQTSTASSRSRRALPNRRGSSIIARCDSIS